MTSVFTVDECWVDEWRGRTALAADAGGFRLATDADPAPSAHLAGTLLPGFRDAHVHLGLVDGTALLAAGIAAVDDCGWDLDAARAWAQDDRLPVVRYAGRFLSAPGGYPEQAAWAPRGSIEPVASAADADGAVRRQYDAGASFVKVTLNSDAGPVLDDATLLAVVTAAHSRGMLVVAHTQGIGQARRAFEAGVDRLAHSPWSEALEDDLLAAMARSQSWVSTLDIHGWGHHDRDFEIAQDNLRRFAVLGGVVLYGTDLGNGPLPLGVNERELRALAEAGLAADALVACIASGDGGAAAGLARSDARATGADASSRFLGRRASHIAAERSPDVAGWLATASVITTETLEEHCS